MNQRNNTRTRDNNNTLTPWYRQHLWNKVIHNPDDDFDPKYIFPSKRYLIIMFQMIWKQKNYLVVILIQNI